MPFSSNPIHNCRYNEKFILHLLRLKQRESKANLARLCGLSAAAVGGIMTSLYKKGLVENVGKVRGDMGQPATLFSLAGDGAYGIGVSINRGHIETLLINFVGDVLASKKHHIILPSPKKALKLILKDINNLIKSVPDDIQDRMAGIGIARPFQIGCWQSNNDDWKAWDDFDLAERLRENTGWLCFTQNDVNAAAIAELIYGVKSEDCLYLFFGSSLVQSFGGGLILNGDCRDGAGGNAGDIGLMPVPVGKLSSTPPAEENTTALTHRCAFSSLVNYLNTQGAQIENHEQLEQALDKNRKAFQHWLDDCSDALVYALNSIQAVLDLPEVVVDCEDRDSIILDNLLGKLQTKLRTRITPGLASPIVRKGTFGSQSAAIGAATLPLDSSFRPKMNP